MSNTGSPMRAGASSSSVESHPQGEQAQSCPMSAGEKSASDDDYHAEVLGSTPNLPVPDEEMQSAEPQMSSRKRLLKESNEVSTSGLVIEPKKQKITNDQVAPDQLVTLSCTNYLVDEQVESIQQTIKPNVADKTEQQPADVPPIPRLVQERICYYLNNEDLINLVIAGLPFGDVPVIILKKSNAVLTKFSIKLGKKSRRRKESRKARPLQFSFAVAKKILNASKDDYFLTEHYSFKTQLPCGNGDERTYAFARIAKIIYYFLMCLDVEKARLTLKGSIISKNLSTPNFTKWNAVEVELRNKWEAFLGAPVPDNKKVVQALYCLGSDWTPLLRWICPRILTFSDPSSNLFDEAGKLTITGVDILRLPNILYMRDNVDRVVANFNGSEIKLGLGRFSTEVGFNSLLNNHVKNGSRTKMLVCRDCPQDPPKHRFPWSEMYNKWRAAVGASDTSERGVIMRRDEDTTTMELWVGYFKLI